MMDTQVILYILAGLLMLVGLAGVVLPALPGLPLVFIGMLLAAFANDFQAVGMWTLVLLGLLTALSLVIDFWATAIGAKRVGASRKAIIGSVLGMLAGLVLGPFGIFIGAFVGALVGEMIHLRRVDGAGLGQAAKVGAGTWVGIVFGIVLKLALGFAMIGIFLVAWFF